MVRRRFVPFGGIQLADIDTLGATVNLTFAFRDSLSTFSANVGSSILAKEVLAMLPCEVAPGKGARALLRDDGIVRRDGQSSSSVCW